MSVKCIVYPIKPHVYIEKIWFARVYLFFGKKKFCWNFSFFIAIKIAVYCMGKFS